MKKLILTICLVLSIGFVFEASATWYVQYDADTGHYNAWYVHDGKDGNVVFLDY